MKENQQMSLQRNADLHDLDLNGPGHSPRTSPVNRKRKDPPPAPPSKKISPVSGSALYYLWVESV